MHSQLFNCSIAPAQRLINRVYAADKVFQLYTSREGLTVCAAWVNLKFCNVRLAVIRSAIALAEVESYNNFRGQFITANVQIGRWVIQSAVETIKAGIVYRWLFSQVTERLAEIATPLTHVRKLEIFLSGHGLHADKEVV